MAEDAQRPKKTRAARDRERDRLVAEAMKDPRVLAAFREGDAAWTAFQEEEAERLARREAAAKSRPAHPEE
jgi:hypothetical protein